MNNTLFQYLIDNQKIWADIYKEQEKEKRRIRNAEQAVKNYWGNSSAYWKEWKRIGAQINK